MRKTLAGAMVGALSLAVAALAFANPASDTTLDVSMSASPSKAGTKSNPRAAKLTTTIRGGTKSGAGQPATSTRIVIALPRQWNINSKKWPHKARCSLSKVNQRNSDSACPRSSKVGSGTSQALGFNGAVTQNLAVRAYVLTNGNVGFWVQGSTPVAIASMLTGKVKSRTLDVAIPAAVQEPIPGANTGITLLKVGFNAKIRVKKRVRVRGVRRTKTVRMGILETTGCKGGKWTFKVTNVYRDGRNTDTDTVSCRR